MSAAKRFHVEDQPTGRNRSHLLIVRFRSGRHGQKMRAILPAAHHENEKRQTSNAVGKTNISMQKATMRLLWLAVLIVTASELVEGSTLRGESTKRRLSKARTKASTTSDETESDSSKNHRYSDHSQPHTKGMMKRHGVDGTNYSSGSEMSAKDHKKMEMKRMKHVQKKEKHTDMSVKEKHKKHMKDKNKESKVSRTDISEKSTKGKGMNMMGMMGTKSTSVKGDTMKKKMMKKHMKGYSKKQFMPTQSPMIAEPPEDTGAPTPTPSLPPLDPSEPPTQSPVISTSEPTDFPSLSPVVSTLAPTDPIEPTASPITTTVPPTPAAGPRCGCELCTKEVLDRESEGFTCEERIDFAITESDFTELQACAFVASEYADTCGPCHPTCVVATAMPTTAEPTQQPSNSPVSGTSCGCPECNEVLRDVADGVRCVQLVEFENVF